jgi:hypothetical protein
VAVGSEKGQIGMAITFNKAIMDYFVIHEMSKQIQHDSFRSSKSRSNADYLCRE